eukprot:CAMPEP_0173390426 /NCGR_PEP_ID=MMETSP1356-20130122/14816_1 /TAXON_ID=77927 ORGANISM="Hemiselmis virescens, Strain PCC157" /NCGR_SAMPLE_ID=MMETSP1356 /ASSEMBLY_ACC=CAM_ASM_000847 /LENGTH=189 /DNA_ID=CAMNT_0014347809 /DNA_START=5 /DNA_END=574 /DNA_ORIENTATION=+
MARPLVFEVVRPAEGSASRRAAAATRAVVLAALACGAVAAVCLTMGGSEGGVAKPSVEAQQKLFSLPSISLGFRDHEKMVDMDPPLGETPAPVLGAPQVDLKKGTGGKQPLPDNGPALGGPSKRWNFQMDNKLTWPPHDARYIPTGAYATHYKGPYDNDYDWPDDTEVVRNDEWDNSGGVGCGMSGNNC